MDTTVPENPESQRTYLKRLSWMCFREVSQGQHYFAVLQKHPVDSTVQQTEDRGKIAPAKRCYLFIYFSPPFYFWGMGVGEDNCFLNCCRYYFLWSEDKAANTSQPHLLSLSLGKLLPITFSISAEAHCLHGFHGQENS